MTPEELRDRFDDLNTAWFAGGVPSVTFRVSRRMRRTAGLYHHSRREITIAARFAEAFPEEVDSLLLHEMIHALTAAGHGAAFRREWARLRAAGAPVPAEYRSFRHCPEFTPAPPPRHVYACPVCGAEFPRARRFRDPRFCGPCVRAARKSALDPYAVGRQLMEVGPGCQLPLFTEVAG